MIGTRRIQFRKYTEDDLELLLAMSNDPDVMRYIGKGTTWSREETKERLHKFIERYNSEEGTGLMLAFHKTSGDLIGHAGLIPQVVEDEKELEVGYWIVKKYWRQGYGYEMASAWKEYGFKSLGKKRLISIIQHGNFGSIKVAEKNEMTYERDIFFNGKTVRLYSKER